MKPQSFYCIKEKNTSRKITKLVVEGREITDTAMNTTELTMTLEEFLGRYK